MKPRQDNRTLIIRARPESFARAVAAVRRAVVDYPESKTVLSWSKVEKTGFAVTRNKKSITVVECEEDG